MTQPTAGTPWQAVRPDSEASAVVARSLDRAEDLPGLAAAFVEHLAGLAPGPESAARLTQEGAERLLAGIRSAVGLIADQDDPDAALHAEAELGDLGTWLHQAGLDADGLRSVGYALVRTAREGAGPQWTTAVGSAWSAVQAWLVDQLVLGARRQPTLVTPMTPIPAMPVTAEPGPPARGARFPFGRRR
jgi:hypothetical protein